MAARMKLLKMMQEFRGFAELTTRQPQPKPGLFLMQLRSHLLQTTTPKRRHRISIQMLEQADIPKPVLIQHSDSLPAMESLVGQVA